MLWNLVHYLKEIRDDSGGQIGCIFSGQEFVGRAFHFQQRGLSGNELEGGLHFIQRRKRITASVDKERGCGELREMRGARGFRFARRMQRIRQKKQALDQLWLLSSQHRGLPSSVRMAAQKNASGGPLPHDLTRSSQAFAVPRGTRGK